MTTQATGYSSGSRTLIDSLNDPIERVSGPTGLVDALGPIPTFPRRALDAHGRLVPLDPEERRARSLALERTIEALRHLPDEDPPGTEIEMMRGIDANRPPRQKLFVGL